MFQAFCVKLPLKQDSDSRRCENNDGHPHPGAAPKAKRGLPAFYAPALPRVQRLHIIAGGFQWIVDNFLAITAHPYSL